MTEMVFEADSLVIELTVSFPVGGLVQDLIGATVVVIARRKGSAAVNGVATVVDDTTVQAVFAAYSLTVGVWEIQIRAAKSGQTLTIHREEFSVVESF